MKRVIMDERELAINGVEKLGKMKKITKGELRKKRIGK